MTFADYTYTDYDPSGRVIASNDAWVLAREDYIRGDSGPEIAERYGVGLSSLRARAAREGWRRADLPEPEFPVHDEALADGAPPATPADLAALGWTRPPFSVRRGPLCEARGWPRLHRDFKAMAD